MEELYKKIEQKIKSSGYSNFISGLEIYNEISDEIEGKDNGIYLFFSKKSDSIVFEYKIEIMDDSFNLSYLHITDGEKSYLIDFD